MLNLRKMTLLVGAAALLLTSLAFAGDPPAITSFKAAKKASQEQGVPVLLRVGKAWCPSCNAFDKDFQKDESLQASISEHVVLCAVNATEGEGVDLARMYLVADWPVLTFILTNSAGEMMDRWMGYYSPESFMEHLTAAVENPITVKERIARFEEHPTEIDARKLGEIRDYEGLCAEALAYYRRADALNPASETNYDLLILNAMARGAGGNLFEYADVRKQADVAVASSKTQPKHLMKVAMAMGKVAKGAGDVAYFTPYLKLAIEKTEGSEDEGVQKGRKKLMPDYALHIQGNEKKAVELMKANFAESAEPKNWLENANMLNNFAWWCFESEINLDEAEQFARKGIELAEAGRQKGNILDTLAEICNLKGDCGDAVEYIRLAVAEDPENEYFQKQLVRFEKLLAEEAH